MADKRLGALKVVDKTELIDVISERDYAREIVLKDRASRGTPVSASMTQRVLYVRPQQTLEECMALMTEKHLRHLPVLDNGRLVGVISMRDVVKDLIAEKEFLIEQMENYITDRR
jgi:CBS domain-containing protein